MTFPPNWSIVNLATWPKRLRVLDVYVCLLFVVLCSRFFPDVSSWFEVFYPTLASTWQHTAQEMRWCKQSRLKPQLSLQGTCVLSRIGPSRVGKNVGLDQLHIPCCRFIIFTIHALSLILSTTHVTHTTLHFPWVPHIRRLSPSTHAKDKFTLPGHLTHANDAQYVKLLQRFPLLGHVGPSYTASYLLSALWHGGQSWSYSQS